MKRRDYFRRTQQKQYISRPKANPYFRSKDDRKRLFGTIGAIGTVVLMVVLLIVLLAHPFFNITSVTVHGAVQTDRGALSETIRSALHERPLLFFRRQNRFLFRSTALSKTLNDSFAFRDVQIKLQRKQLNIAVVERTSQLIWKSAEEAYVVDLDGIVIRSLDVEEWEHLKTLLPIFVDKNGTKVTVGTSISNRVEISTIFAFNEELQKRQIHVSQTDIDRLSGKWIGTLTQDGYRILFDATSDIKEQVERLDVLLREKISDRSKLEYIDLRFGDHVYYK
ncbi:hypothetical protein HZA85_03525 [Candidatus Uhrbacteria bacterium]|nr:hypothetical protein [Candidatus Uhrbacteria bacterium]